MIPTDPAWFAELYECTGKLMMMDRCFSLSPRQRDGVRDFCQKIVKRPHEEHAATEPGERTALYRGSACGDQFVSAVCLFWGDWREAEYQCYCAPEQHQCCCLGRIIPAAIYHSRWISLQSSYRQQPGRIDLC